MVASLPLGVALGWLLARRSFPGKPLVETLVNLPLVLPPVATGYLLLLLFGRQGLVGGWLYDVFGVEIVFTWKAAAIASGVVGLPLMVRAIRLAFQAVDPGLEHAARSLGAKRLDAFMTVSLPLARPGIVAGSVLAFARSLGEFGATIAFAGNIRDQTRTVPLAVFTAMNQADGMASTRRLVLLAILLAAAAPGG